MTAQVWLHDSAGAWLADLRDDGGELISETAHAPGLRAPIGAAVRIDGSVTRGASLVTVRPRK